MKLAGSTGFELIEKVREFSPHASVIVISGSDSQDDLIHALEKGANDFILKPVDRALLTSKLAKYVDTQRLKEQETKFSEVPAGNSLARLTFPVTLSYFDELGVGFKSVHLIPKGTVIKVKTEFFKETGSSMTEVLTTVTTTSLTPRPKFTPSMPNLMNCLRT